MAKTKKKSKSRQVHVRMYCQGLGDCFLLRFETGKDEFFSMLIDCGIYKASPDAGDIMRSIVEDVAKTTGNKLDVLVSTHEHWDHISGFSQALERFKDMTIGETWMAWTEDPKDAKARELRKKYEAAKAKLAGLINSANAAIGAGQSPALDEAFAIMGFYGLDKTSNEDDAYANIKSLMQSNNPRYFKPRDVEELGSTGVKAFILGPPRDESALRKTDPGKGDGYEKQRQAFFDSFQTALGSVAFTLDGELESERAFRPFDVRDEIPVEAARQSEFFQTLYGFEPEHEEFYRSIDDLAHGTLGRLALRMDSYTNNTSLVIAFQLPSGEVMLFPGDAQAGNWKSWADLDEPLAFGGEKTDAHQLLAATVLYKVAHHGSHNATPKTYGLELMTHPELRALVPVDHEVAASAKYGEMPLIAIMDELQRMTGGAVFRCDGDREVLPTGFLTFSKQMLRIKTTKNGEYFQRPMWCETSLDLE